MASERTAKSGHGTRWSRAEVLSLLCTLNLNIAKIKPKRDNPSREEMKDIMAEAASLLCREVPFSSSAKRIQTKLALLWDGCGDPDGIKKPYALYQHGAFIRTLPGLEDPKVGFPGMLNEIAEESRRQQESALSRAADSPSVPRKSQRPGIRDESCDAIICKCGFAHSIATVKCDSCPTWQHTLCYYNTSLDEDIPETHSCDNCQTSLALQDQIVLDEVTDQAMLTSFQSLRLLALDEAYESHQRRLEDKFDIDPTNPKAMPLGPFGYPQEDEMFWGPTDREIRSTMQRIISKTENITYLLLKAGLSVQNIKRVLRGRDMPSVSGFLPETAFIRQCQEHLLDLLSQPVQSQMRIAQMLTGMISSLAVEMVFYNKSNANPVTSVYESMCRSVIDVNGVQTLRHLRRRCLINVLKNNSDQWESLLSLQVETMTRSLQDLLKTMLKQSGVSGKSLPSFIPRGAWEKLTDEVVNICLKLKLQMTISERFYEMHNVLIGTKASPNEMVDTTGGFVAKGEIVEACLMPAVIEYTPEQLGRDLTELLVDPGQQVFVRTSPKDRLKGIVVSPAIVFVTF